MLANRMVKLCRMFIEESVLKCDEVEKQLNPIPINDTDKNMPHVMLNQSPPILSHISNQPRTDTSYLIKINELERTIEENNIREQVDYIIREGLEFTEPGNLTADEEGWYLKITPKTTELNLYLYEIVQALPNKLKDRLLHHINGEEYPYWYEFMLRDAPHRKSPMESLLDEGSKWVIQKKDVFGVAHEVRYETVHLYGGGSNPISIETLKKIVSDAKNLVNNPNLAIELLIERLLKRRKYQMNN